MLLEILRRAPLWVWPLFVLLLALGAARWPRGVAYFAETRSFRVSGSWVPLVLMMGIFFARYAAAPHVLRRRSDSPRSP